jgi:hypothetical protein
VSHIALEWMHTGTGRLLVTAKVLCWKDQVVSTIAENLMERWYAFHPTEILGLDSLPTVEGGWYLALSAYRDQMLELGAQDQRLQMNWPKTQEEWTDLLGQLGLDPELFRYQRTMNRDEGEAVHAFTLDSDNGFVDFLLKAVFDHKGLNELATLVSTYAHKLAGRKDLLLELEFVEQAMALLEPLIDAWQAANGSRARGQQAARELELFHGQVQARIRDDLGRVGALEQREESLATELLRADGRTRRWAATVAWQQQVLAQLRLTLAKRAAEETARGRQQAQGVVNGWRATGVVHRHLAKSAAAKELTLLVKVGELAAEPALAARERSAQALAKGLLALRDQAHREQEKQNKQALAEAAAEKEDRLAREDALREADRAESKARALLEQVGAARLEAEEAVTAGLAPAADLVPRAAQDAHRAVDLAQEKITTLELEQDRLDRQQPGIQESLSAAVREQEAARGRAAQARQSQLTALSRTSAIETVPRLAEVLGAAVRLDLDAQVLLDRLTEEMGKAERGGVELRVEQTRDERALLALRDGQLLPPPQVVIDACRVLEQAVPPINAWPGWTYLAEFPLQQREEMLARAPHLVSGVLLNSAEDQERAGEILGQAPPTAYHVSVGTAAGLLEGSDGPDKGVLFTLPFNAALYEEAAAAAEQDVIEARWAHCEEQLKKVRSAQQHDGDLRHRISQWREDYPAGALTGLQEAVAAAEAALEEKNDEAAAQQSAMDRLLGRREEIGGELHDLREEHERWREAARHLAELTGRLTQIPSWLEQAGQAEEQHRTHSEQAKKLEASADGHRLLAEKCRTAGGKQRQVAFDAGQEWAALPGAREMRYDGEAPADPVPVLRDAYHKARANFDNLNVPGHLRAELAQAEAAAREAAADYSALPEADRSAARQLLETPEGLDERSRAEALDLALSALASAEDAAGRAAVEQGKHDNALRERQEAYRKLTADGTEPMDAAKASDTVEGCLAAVAAAQTEHAGAAKAEAEALTQRTDAGVDTKRARDAAKAFEQLAQALAGTPAEQGAAYAGDDGWQDYVRLEGAAKGAKEELHRDEKILRGAADQLNHHAATKKYSHLTIPVRQQIIELTSEQSAEQAADWLAALAPRKRNLSDEISEVTRHRQTIIDHLKGESDKALSMLRSAQRLSQLPHSLGDWGGQEFLQFSFQPQPDELLLPRLGELAEEAAAGQTPDGRRVARDGVSLLLRAVHTAVPGGFKVQVLKPDTVLRTERIRVSKVKDVLSGGQQLTAAILLYCTMAALRANQQGRARSRHSGVLFLDNPIGRANADYLLDLQRQVAQALGVQLIYNTGLYDEKALGKFPLIVRLRNDADLRAARKYLVVDDVFRPYLDALAPEDGTGQVDSARIFRREEHDGTEGDDETAAPGE